MRLREQRRGRAALGRGIGWKLPLQTRRRAGRKADDTPLLVGGRPRCEGRSEEGRARAGQGRLCKWKILPELVTERVSKGKENSR